MRQKLKRKGQEIRANAHETRDSISLISYAGCLDLSAVTSAKIHSLNVRRSLKSRKKTLKRYFSISWSLKVIDVGTPGKVGSSACYDKQKSVSICNRSLARLGDSSRNCAF